MTYDFVTIFNNLYLPQAISLYNSLNKFKFRFRLWAICLDDESTYTIENLGISNFKTINFTKFENKKLANIKKKRTVAEYCWTLTPMSPKIIFGLNKNIKFVTYLDADMYFFNNPKFLIDEFVKSKQKILFTKHDFNDDQKYKEEKFGKFCVQFMTFKKFGSEKIRKIWEKKCIKWCYAEPEKGKMGDQKYLDNIYNKYKREIFVADEDFFRSTWNYKKINFNKILAWHFHGLKIVNKKLLLMHPLEFLPENIKKYIYFPYIKSINSNIKKIRYNKTQFVFQRGKLINLFNKIKFRMLELKIIKMKRYINLN